MSKQYITVHSLPPVHPTDIFSLAVAPQQILSASGGSSILVHDTTSSDYPLTQTIKGAHKLGCHHICTSRNGQKAASAGFDGRCRIWAYNAEQKAWEEDGEVLDGIKPGEVWAIALSEDGRYLAATSIDGRINVWDLSDPDGRKKIREFETKGSFGTSIALSVDGLYTASGHQNGSVYLFNNETGRLAHSLPGLIKPVRAVAFSPGTKLLAAAGDARIIALYDVAAGEQVANFTGHSAWIFSLDWSDTGEYLLSGSYDGKAKVWSVETRTCVATQSESDKTLWSVKWLPKTRDARGEMFAIAGASRGISFYRESGAG